MLLQFVPSRTFLFPIFCFGAFSFGVYAYFSESMQTALIPQQSVNFPVIAKVIDLQGQSQRKLISDVLWFPIAKNTPLYLGDSVQTSDQSSLLLEISNGGRIAVDANSMITLRFLRQKPLIVLKKGHVEFSSDTDEEIYVSSGERTEKVKVSPKSSATVREHGSGNLETEYKDHPVRQVKVAATASTAEPVEQATPGQQNVVQIQDQKKILKDKFERPVTYPYPTSHTVFLKKHKGEIRIFPKAICLESCSLSVSFNGQTLETRRFAPKGEPNYLVRYQDSTVGLYKWTLQEGPQNLQGEFQVEDLSKENIRKFIDNHQPLEIMSDL